jgi:hypothetical protein
MATFMIWFSSAMQQSEALACGVKWGWLQPMGGGGGILHLVMVLTVPAAC